MHRKSHGGRCGPSCESMLAPSPGCEGPFEVSSLSGNEKARLASRTVRNTVASEVAIDRGFPNKVSSTRPMVEGASS